MSQSGTMTEYNTGYSTILVEISGMSEGTNSPPFTLRGLPYTSAVVFGTFGGTTAQWQGSNDGVTWVDIGTTFTSGPAGGTLTPDNTPYLYYQLVLTGGTGVSLTAFISASRAG